LYAFLLLRSFPAEATRREARTEGHGVHRVIEESYRTDLIFQNNVELKLVEKLLPVHAKRRTRVISHSGSGTDDADSARQQRERLELPNACNEALRLPSPF
jgi:hypothetical protein